MPDKSQTTKDKIDWAWTKGYGVGISFMLIAMLILMSTISYQRHDCEIIRGGAFVKTAFWFTCLPKNEGVLRAKD